MAMKSNRQIVGLPGILTTATEESRRRLNRVIGAAACAVTSALFQRWTYLIPLSTAAAKANLITLPSAAFYPIAIDDPKEIVETCATDDNRT